MEFTTHSVLMIFNKYSSCNLKQALLCFFFCFKFSSRILCKLHYCFIFYFIGLIAHSVYDNYMLDRCVFTDEIYCLNDLFPPRTRSTSIFSSQARVPALRTPSHSVGHVSCSCTELVWPGLCCWAMLYCLLPKYRHLSPFICKTRETLLLFTTKGVILKERREKGEKKGMLCEFGDQYSYMGLGRRGRGK